MKYQLFALLSLVFCLQSHSTAIAGGYVYNTTATWDSTGLGPDVQPGGPVKDGQLTVIGQFMQVDLDAWNAGKGYVPKGRVGALTNNPQNCILTEADGGYNHRSTPGAQPLVSSNCAGSYYSSSPQTAPATGLIVNDATQEIASSVNLATADTRFSMTGLINFTMDPVTGQVTQMGTTISQQNRPEITDPTQNHAFDYSFTLTAPATFISSPTHDEVIDEQMSAGTRNTPWTSRISQPSFIPGGQDFIIESQGTTNGIPFASPMFATVPGYRP